MDRSSFSSRLFAKVAVGVLLFFSMITPLLAQAQLDSPSVRDKAGAAAGYPVTISENIPERLNGMYENLRWELLGTGAMAFMNAMQTFFGQLAYDAADYIASGGKGQSALFYKKGFREYLADVAGSAAGEYIGTLSQSSFFQTIGFDLCRPPDPRTLLRVQLSLGQFLETGTNQAFQRPAAKCEFNDIVRNYDQVYQTLSNGDVIRNVELGLSPNANDLGVTMSIFNRAFGFVTTRQSGSEQDRKEGGGYQALRDIVSGRIRTPSETIREEANQVLVKDPKANQEQVNSFIIQQVYNLGPSRLAQYTASIFLNTLASKALNRLFTEGIDFDALFNGRRINFAGSGPDDLLQPSREDKRKAAISLRTPNLFQEAAYDVLAELQTCPDNRGTWNCVVDEGLAQALRSRGDSGSFTLREAMDRGYLKDSWRLYPSTSVREERDPLCYTYGYCSGNLRKLRSLRVLPLGFEFAANDPVNVDRCTSEKGCVTLKEVIEGFTNCNDSGEKDADHPWCKLINPNWALTIPPQQCALSGFGEVMLGKGVSQRREECQDIQTCLKRNDKGECVGGYGYCMAEKTVYRFGGQECSERYASCRSYASRAGDQVAYLRNTLEYGGCSEDNVGCMWYATTRSTQSERVDNWIGDVSSGSRIYFDKTMESCSASVDGCTTLLAAQPGASALNLVANSSFERTLVGTSNLEAWLAVSGSDTAYVRPTVTVGEATADGLNGAVFAGGFASGYRQLIVIPPGRNMVLSAYARRLQANGAASLSIRIVQYPSMAKAMARTGAIDPAATARDFRSIECVGRNIQPNTSALTGGNSTNWQRVQCGFTSHAAATVAELIIEGGGTTVDAVQLEDGLVAMPYVDGVNSSLEAVHHRLPPEEFACTGSDTDHPGCASYARICRQTEAGCDGYSDTASVFPEVTAQVGNGDLCPSACVGYAEYRQLASSFDLVRSTDPAQDDPAHPTSTYFIPSTAQQCSQADVGCETFTVANSGAQGGEAQASFSSLRACEVPSDDTETYFTWEGSESAGYQLRTWSLKRRTTQKPGEIPPEGAAIGPVTGPRIVIRRSADLFSIKDQGNCNEQNWRTGGDPDCRQFYNSTGQVFYRYYSQTVLSTAECRQYRLSGASAADCQKTGGAWNGDGQVCLYQAYAPESRACAPAVAGCRAYAGAEAGNTLNVYSANNAETKPITGTRSSTESVYVGDTSYRLDVAPSANASANVLFPSATTSLYRVNFWVKASSPVMMVLNAAQETGGTDPKVVGTVRVTGEWQRVSLGLFSGAGTNTRLRWNVSGGNTAASVFMDEITVQQLRDVVFVRKNTWNTPAQCDQTAYGIPEPQAMLGCREYRNRGGELVNVRQFSQLCRPAAVGCREFVDTRNTDSPYGQRYSVANGNEPSVTDVKPDRYVYVIDNINARCDAASASCRAFGKPVFSADRSTIARFETVYLKDDVSKYTTGLCRPLDLFCEEFTTAFGREYFKDPQAHTCVYKERVEVTGVTGVQNGTYSGWFVNDAQSANKPCYPEALVTGQNFQMLRTGDASPGAGYQGWAGICPTEESECTEFRDPNDLDPVTKVGRGYYFLKDDRIDIRSCGDQVNPAQGCVLLRDMSNIQLTYNTVATQKAYEASNLQAVTPTNCEANSAAPGCAGAATGRCTATRVSTRYNRTNGARISELRTPYVGGMCATSNDCAPETRTTYSGEPYYYSVNGYQLRVPGEYKTEYADVTCERMSANDANLIVKIAVDRDCAQWLGCSSAETVYDSASNRYREVCTQVALCDQSSVQGGSSAYCTNYVDRATTGTEPVLVQGGFLDAKRYTSRPSSGSARDYSGYAIPNAFQVPDLQARTISADFSPVQAGLPQDRRFVAVAKMPPLDIGSLINPEPIQLNGRPVLVYGRYRHAVAPTRSNQAEIIQYTPQVYGVLSNSDADFARRNPIFLCRHRGTGQIGYALRSEVQSGREVNCYLGFQADGRAADFLSLLTKYLAKASNQDITLDEAYLKSMCRAYPEPDAPYSSKVVTRWDMTINPIKPVAVRSGYQSANFCAYGEECLCSYKRVEYPGMIKPMFFDAISQAVPPGICVGGPRNGQSCIPSEVFDLSTTTSTSAKIAEAANNAQTCGPTSGGGRCVAFDKVEIVRGTQGTCLEYDTTRSKGKRGEEEFSCLTWSPSPIVGGKDDQYRYVETAGYFPPQNSGQYYCTAKAKAPTSVMLTDYSFRLRPNGVAKLDYNDDFVSDASELADGNFPGSYLGGVPPKGSQAATLCEDADDDQDDDGPFEADTTGLRIVATGRGAEASYTETFYGIDGRNIAALFYRGAGTVPPALLRDALLEQNFSFIEVRPFENPNGYGRLACGYQTDWVDGVSIDDYDDQDKLAKGDKDWRQRFFAEADLQLYLSRGSEQMVTDAGRNNRPVKMRCYDSDDGTTAVGSECYFKTWEIGYRASTQANKFVGFRSSEGGAPRGSFQSLAESPIYSRCTSEKPYYAIRAVFQSAASNQTGDPDTIEARNIRGPWRFAGFWVSTCGGQTQTDNRFIYMNIRIQNADICRELAEVRSYKTNQDAAFTDRVWSESKYRVPMLGIEYGMTFAPFSSALNTGPAGTDPLYQMGGRLAGSSPLRPPIFLASGFSTYYGDGSTGSPRDRYAYLSNLFARIYRVYKYNDQRIAETDRTCANPNNSLSYGKKCVPDTPPNQRNVPDSGPSQDCRASAQTAFCDTTVPPVASIKVCNALSGLNRGLSCNGAPDMCHSYAVDPTTLTSRNPRPLLGSCVTQDGWTSDNGSYRNEGLVYSRVEAAERGAFRCGSGSVRQLGIPQTEVVACPLASDWRQGSGAPLRDETSFCRNAAREGEPPRCVDRVTAAASGAFNCNGEANLNGLITRVIGPGAPGGTYYCTNPSTQSEECPLEVTGTCVAGVTLPMIINGIRVGTMSAQDKHCSMQWTENGQTRTADTPLTCQTDNDCSFNATHFWRWSEANSYASLNELRSEGKRGFVLSPRSVLMSGVNNQTTISGRATGPATQLMMTTQKIIGSPGTALTELTNYPGASRQSLPLGEVGYLIGGCESVSTMMSGLPGVSAGTCSDTSVRAGQVCIAVEPTADATYRAWSGTVQASCQAPAEARTGGAMDECEPVTDANNHPAPRCRLPNGAGASQTRAEWYSTAPGNRIPQAERSMNNDNNSCTAEVGYRPDPSACPDPSNEFCGLLTYDMRRDPRNPQQPLSPNSLNKALDLNPRVPLPTDVTLGHYTPSYLGFTGLPENTYTYLDYYTPRPPRIAAPMSSCPAGTVCGVQDLDRFNFNGITQGIVNVIGGQHRSSIKFYGWAAHEQMALRRLAVDWGDGTVEQFNDVRLKNHKPVCSVQKECYSPATGFTGLTCESDTECPLSAQACRQMGSCKEKQNLTCAQDSDCRRDGSKDACVFRAFFGNSGEACEASPFEFAHVYNCSATAAQALPSCIGQNYSVAQAIPVPSNVVTPANGQSGTCFFGTYDRTVLGGAVRPVCTTQSECLTAYTRLANGTSPTAEVQGQISCGAPINQRTGVLPDATEARCSGDTTRHCRNNNDCAAGDRCIAAGIAPPGGCWDSMSNTCRFTPRLFLQDNWGWCTGECRAARTGELLTDTTGAVIRHPYGGCYSPVPEGADPQTGAARLNTSAIPVSRAGNELLGQARAVDDILGLECSIDRPFGTLNLTPTGVTSSDPRRSYRPWIVFPGSLQLRPR